MNKIRSAFGLDPEAKEGQAFDRDLQERLKAERFAEREAKQKAKEKEDKKRKKEQKKKEKEQKKLAKKKAKADAKAAALKAEVRPSFRINCYIDKNASALRVVLKIWYLVWSSKNVPSHPQSALILLYCEIAFSLSEKKFTMQLALVYAPSCKI